MASGVAATVAVTGVVRPEDVATSDSVRAPLDCDRRSGRPSAVAAVTKKFVLMLRSGQALDDVRSRGNLPPRAGM